MKNTITEMKNILQGINTRVDEAEDQLSNLEDKGKENYQNNTKKKRIQKNEDSVRSL